MENVYSSLKMFHFRDRLEVLAADDVSAPLHIRIKPINACNHRCSYCCYRSDNLYLGQLMNEKDMIPAHKMREIVADLTTAGIRAVTFTGGGEPLLYPYFVQTVEKLLEDGVKVATLTNGAMLNGARAKVLARGASWVRISMDAVDGTTIRMTRNAEPEEFDRILRNIAAFSKSKHRDCELGVNFIVTQMNANKVYDFLKKMRDCGVDHVKVSECVVGTTAEENNTYHEDHFTAVQTSLARAQSDLSGTGFKVIDKFHEFEAQYNKHYTQCPFVAVFLNVIGADLNVYTCQDKAYTKAGLLGSIKERSLKEFWESSEYRNAVKSIDPSRICDHHCVQNAKNLALLDYLGTDRRHFEFV